MLSYCENLASEEYRWEVQVRLLTEAWLPIRTRLGTSPCPTPRPGLEDYSKKQASSQMPRLREWSQMEGRVMMVELRTCPEIGRYSRKSVEKKVSEITAANTMARTKLCCTLFLCKTSASTSLVIEPSVSTNHIFKLSNSWQNASFVKRIIKYASGYWTI